MTGFVEVILRRIDGRLGELREEEARLTTARTELLRATRTLSGSPAGNPGSPAKAPRTRRRAGRPPGRAKDRTSQALR